MTQIDDSALLHGKPYDPRQAHEYYLRRRQLKGRKKGSGEEPLQGRAPGGHPGGGSKASGHSAEMQAQKAALEKRLDRLKDVLAKLVDAAKRRSGVDVKEKTSKASKAKDDKPTKEKPKTAAEKREAAKKAREDYKKEHQSPSKELQDLRTQIADIQKQIKAALEEARKKAAKTQSQTASKGR